MQVVTKAVVRAKRDLMSYSVSIPKAIQTIGDGNIANRPQSVTADGMHHYGCRSTSFCGLKKQKCIMKSPTETEPVGSSDGVCGIICRVF
jgi:hypothetical protein